MGQGCWGRLGAGLHRTRRTDRRSAHLPLPTHPLLVGDRPAARPRAGRRCAGPLNGRSPPARRGRFPRGRQWRRPHRAAVGRQPPVATRSRGSGHRAASRHRPGRNGPQGRTYARPRRPRRTHARGTAVAAGRGVRRRPGERRCRGRDRPPLSEHPLTHRQCGRRDPVDTERDRNPRGVRGGHRRTTRRTDHLAAERRPTGRPRRLVRGAGRERLRLRARFPGAAGSVASG